MTSSVNVVAAAAAQVGTDSKHGWFNSLKRTRKTKSSSTVVMAATAVVPVAAGAGLSSAKSLSSLNHGAVVHSVHPASSTVQLNSPAGHHKSPWKFKFHRHHKHKDSGSSHHLDQSHPPPPSLPEDNEQPQGDKSAFYTLPRKRSEPRPPSTLIAGDTSPAVAAVATTSSRSRSYSTAAIVEQRQKKRSTVWYTCSESDIHLKGRVSWSSR